MGINAEFGSDKHSSTLKKEIKGGKNSETIWGNNQKQLKGRTWKEEKSLNAQHRLRERRKAFFPLKIPTRAEDTVTVLQPSLRWSTPSTYSLSVDTYFHSNRLQTSLSKNLPNPVSKVCRRLDALGRVSERLAVWSLSFTSICGRPVQIQLTRLEGRAQVTSSCDPIGFAFFCGSKLNLQPQPAVTKLPMVKGCPSS